MPREKPTRSRNKDGRFRKKRSDTGVPRGPQEPKSDSKGTLSGPGVEQERAVDFIEEVESQEVNGRFDEETECYYIRGLECVNLIDEETFRALLADGVESSARPTDDRTCGLCMQGFVVEALHTIIGNIPNLIPLIKIQKRENKKDE